MMNDIWMEVFGLFVLNLILTFGILFLFFKKERDRKK